MNSQDIQTNAIETYNNNLTYLEQSHTEIYKKIILLNEAIELKAIKETYALEYKNSYFDINNQITNQKYYGTDSLEFSKKMIEEQVNFNPKKNSFKTYYEFDVSQRKALNALNSNVLSNFYNENAPFINFFKSKLPAKEELKKIYKYIVLGTGLGLHIPLIHDKINALFYLIIEPNLEIFRLSLFVTDYSRIAESTTLIFSVAEGESQFKENFKIFLSYAYVFDHYIKLFKLSNESNSYINYIQDVFVSQDHLSYRYDRIFLNIYRTHKNIENNYNILHLEKLRVLEFTKKPILVLAAGPSLQKNIDFVKENQDKFIIIAIYATLPLLEKHQIVPDIVTQYDEQKEQVLNTINKINDLSFFDKTIFLFASHLNEKVYTTFNKENIFIFQGLYNLKIDFGTLTSPSIGELTYALSLMLDTKEIYLLGLDLAFNTKTGKTHIDGHSGSAAFKDLKSIDDSKVQEYSSRNNTIELKGNFEKYVSSTPVFNTSINILNLHTKNYKKKDTKVYNLSEGAYFQETIPLKIEDININQFSLIDKNKLFDKSMTFFKEISEQGYNKRDKESIVLKKNNIKRLQKILKRFKDRASYKSFSNYQDTLFVLFDELLTQNKQDKDLENLLQNFALNNLHYIFYILNLKDTPDYSTFYKELNTIIYNQFNKIIDTYSVSLHLYEQS